MADLANKIRFQPPIYSWGPQPAIPHGHHGSPLVCWSTCAAAAGGPWDSEWARGWFNSWKWGRPNNWMCGSFWGWTYGWACCGRTSRWTSSWCGGIAFATWSCCATRFLISILFIFSLGLWLNKEMFFSVGLLLLWGNGSELSKLLAICLPLASLASQRHSCRLQAGVVGSSWTQNTHMTVCNKLHAWVFGRTSRCHGHVALWCLWLCPADLHCGQPWCQRS